MKIASIIAEYNPLHGGHAHHINNTKEQTNSDYLITILSGNYVQRGLPALIDKYQRTKFALLAGSDLVIELPTWYALSSAEGFAFGGVSLLNQLGCVDTLSFGSEDGALSDIQTISKILVDEPPLYRELLKNELQAGSSLPLAINNALYSLNLNINSDILNGKSNNILAVEYCKSLLKLNSSINPFTIKRNGDAYHEVENTCIYPSATYIRKCIKEGLSLPSEPSLPNFVSQFLEIASKENTCIFGNDFNQALVYKLQLLSHNELTSYYDVNSSIANKILNTRLEFENFDTYSNLLWSKDLTYARICRCLFHILLEMKETDYDARNQTPYARILGFKKKATPLLSHLKANTDIPLISKLADAHKILNNEALFLLNKDIEAAHIYNSIVALKSQTKTLNEYSSQIVII